MLNIFAINNENRNIIILINDYLQFVFVHVCVYVMCVSYVCMYV